MTLSPITKMRNYDVTVSYLETRIAQLDKHIESCGDNSTSLKPLLERERVNYLTILNLLTDNKE